MRRVLIGVVGLFATTALLVALKSGPGVMRLPDQVPVIQRVAPSSSTEPTPSGEPGPDPEPADPPPSPEPGAPTTFTGDSVYSEFGYVTVQIAVVDGQIVDVVALEMPTDGARSAALSERVAATMRERVLAAQSADVDTVSGATWTSEAYRQSLRSALAKAGLT
jgi:uncharacterized protein with FMN-binding domain